MKRHLLLFALLLLISGVMYGQSYHISVLADPDEGGSPYTSDSLGDIHIDFNFGEQCILHAHTNIGYTFVNWTVGHEHEIVNDSVFSFVVTQDSSFVAHFAKTDYTITYIDDGNGTCSGAVTANYGDEVTVTVNPNQGYELNTLTYNGDDVPLVNGEYKFMMPDSNVEVIATFVLSDYTITYTDDGHGTCSGDTTANYGDEVMVTVDPDSGYELKTLKYTPEGGTTIDITSSMQFTMPASAVAVYATFMQTYTITVSADPDCGAPYIGDTLGTTQASFTSGQSCTVHANPNVGYTFLRWTEYGTQVSTNANYMFTVTGNRDLAAHFTHQQHTINVSANPSNGGTVTGGAAYYYGETCTVSATANNGYTFDNWTENDTVVSTNANYSFDVTCDRTLVANFSALPPNTFNINVSANPANGGMVTGGGSYQQGQSCTVTATPAAGYTFLRWTENDNQVCPNASYTFTVTGNRTLVAQFQALPQYNISVSANPSNGGNVSGGGTYQQGQQCTVHAVANTNAGYTFTNWTENGSVVSLQANYQFTVTSNRNLVANFQAPTHTISVSANPYNGGSVYVGTFPGTTQAPYTQGQSCTVHATPAQGYTFEKWTEDGIQVSTDDNYTFVVYGSRNLVAQFKPNTYTVTVKPNPEDDGEAYIGDDQNVQQLTFNHGEVCWVHARAHEGFEFFNWTDESNSQVSREEDFRFNVVSDSVLLANFIPAGQIRIYVEIEPENGGTTTGAGPYNEGDTCNLTARANYGYSFENWTDSDNNEVSDTPNYIFEVTGTATYVAHFRIKNYSISATANPSTGGTINGEDIYEGTYNHGTTCRLKASPDDGYSFTNWTEDGIVVWSDSEYSFEVTENHILVANFESLTQTYAIQTKVYPSDCGVISVDHSEATAGTPVKITVENIADGYELDTLIVYKTDSELLFVEVTDLTFIMPSYPVTVKAEFRQKSLEINPPDPICSGEVLSLIKPSGFWAQNGIWQLSPTDAFDPENTITYDNEILDGSYNHWYLRYHVQIFNHIWNSNVVQITVNSMDGLTLEGNEQVSIDQEVEYWIVIEDQNDYSNYTFTWSVSDVQADTAIIDNRCKVTWKTSGMQWVSVIISDTTTGCTDTFGMDVNVTACIDNLQKIVAKEHKEGNVTYSLVLVYPNPSDEEYKYQWRFSSNGENYSDLQEGTSNKQYYYKGGSLNEGYYKVRISKDDCSVETEPYYVSGDGRLRMYPNPTKRGTEIVVMKDCTGSAQLTIYSTDGRVLHTQTLTDIQTSIGISLPQGVYVAYLTNSDGYTKVGKLIIH